MPVVIPSGNFDIFKTKEVMNEVRAEAKPALNMTYEEEEKEVNSL